MISIEQIVNTWNTFFFEPEPVFTIALFRISIGIILLFNAFFITLDAKSFFHPRGVLDYRTFRRKFYKTRFSLLSYLPRTFSSVKMILALHWFSIICLILGFFTKINSILVFITLISILHRNPYITNGGETVLRMMSFFLIFTPCGNTFSLDEYFFYSSAGTTDYLYASPWAARLMQIQLAIIYVRTVYWKLKGTTWRDGTAFYYACHISRIKRHSFPSFFFSTPFVQIATWGTLLLELALGVFIWIEDFSYPMIIAGILFHLIIEYSMVLHVFSWIMIASLLLFVDPNDLAFLTRSFIP